MRNVPRGLPLWSSQCIFQKPIQAPVSFNAGTSFQHTTHQRVASLTPPGSLQVAATILGGFFIKNTENNQFSPSNHQLYTGLQKIRVQLAVSQRSIVVSTHLQIYSTQYCSINASSDILDQYSTQYCILKAASDAASNKWFQSSLWNNMQRQQFNAAPRRTEVTTEVAYHKSQSGREGRPRIRATDSL